MSTPLYSVVLSAAVVPTSTVSVGQLLVLGNGTYVLSTAANRAIYGRSSGMALDSYGGTAATGFVRIQAVGYVDPTTSGIAAGAADRWVRASSTGSFEVFTPANGGTSDIVGKADANGAVTLVLGVWTESMAALDVSGQTFYDAILGYGGMSAPSALPLGTSSIGPRVITSSYFDDGNPSVDGFVQQVAASLTTTSAAAGQQIYGAPLGVLGSDWSVALDVIISVRALGGAFGRAKRSVCFRRIGSAAPTIVGTLETGTDQGTIGGTIAIGASFNNVVLSVTPSDSTKRIWTAEVHSLFQPTAT